MKKICSFLAVTALAACISFQASAQFVIDPIRVQEDIRKLPNGSFAITTTIYNAMTGHIWSQVTVIEKPDYRRTF